MTTTPYCFYTYHPDSHWCNEGIAQADDKGRLIDTYWGIDASPECELSRKERESAVFFFNPEFYDMLPDAKYSEENWEKFAPSDRERVTSQHGLQVRYFVRKGAKHHLATQIENAKRKLEEANMELRNAKYRADRAENDLAELLEDVEAL